MDVLNDENKDQKFVSEKVQMYAELFAFFLSCMKPEDVEKMTKKMQEDTERATTASPYSSK